MNHYSLLQNALSLAIKQMYFQFKVTFVCNLYPDMGLQLGYSVFPANQNSHDSSGMCCSRSVKINTCETPHGMGRSWMHFVCVRFRVCVGNDPNTPNWSSMTDDANPQGGLHRSGISGINLCIHPKFSKGSLTLSSLAAILNHAMSIIRVYPRLPAFCHNFR